MGDKWGVWWGRDSKGCREADIKVLIIQDLFELFGHDNQMQINPATILTFYHQPRVDRAIVGSFALLHISDTKSPLSLDRGLFD